MVTVTKIYRGEGGDLGNQLFPPSGDGKQSYRGEECIETNGLGKYGMKVRECPSVQQRNRTKV